MNLQKPYDQIKMSRNLFIMCWIVYCIIYFGRTNYSAALAGIIQQGIFTKVQAGLIGTVFFFCYGIGQLISGMFGDRVSPYKMIFIGLFISMLANLLLPFGKSYIIMAFIWGINGFAQSMIWAPILFIISRIIVEDMRKKACLYIASSVPVGTMLTYLVSMIIMRYFSWKAIFFTTAAIFLPVVIFWYFTSRNAAKILGFGEPIEMEKLKEFGNSKNFFKLFISSGTIFLSISAFMHGMLKDGVNSWVPTMIVESYGVSTSFSMFLTMFLPMINLSGAYLATYIYFKFLKNNEVLVGVLFLIFSIIPLTVLLFIGKIHVQTSILMLALFTTSMQAFNHMMTTRIPIRFAKYNRTSTASGLINSIAYTGCAISNYGFGYTSYAMGWQKTILIWIIIAVVAIMFCFFALKMWSNFIK